MSGQSVHGPSRDVPSSSELLEGTRELFAVTVDAYEDEDEHFREAIARQVRVMRDWVCLEPHRFRITEPDWGASSATEALDAIKAKLIEQRQEEDAVLLYISGHGDVGPRSGNHALRLPDLEVYPTAQLIEAAMGSGAGSVVVLVDSCHAGALRGELDGMLNDLEGRLKGRDRELPQRTCVALSANFDQRIRVEEFVGVVSNALELMRDQYAEAPDQPYASARRFWDAMDDAASELGVEIRLAWPPRNPHREPCRALPSPAYRPKAVLTAAATSSVALTADEIDEHWMGKASGRASSRDAGWYFSGRERLMGRVVGFLAHEETEAQLLIVTGESGSGKSAIIARAVTLADRRFRADSRYSDLITAMPPHLLPPQGSIDVAINARGLTPNQLAKGLADAMVQRTGVKLATNGGLPWSVSTWATEIAQALGRPLSVVIDGLDETTNPTQTISNVITPLMVAECPLPAGKAARIIVGVRGSAASSHDVAALLLRALGERALTVRTDEPTETRPDIESYLVRLLRESGPYAAASLATSDSQPTTHSVKEVARLVATHVTPRFLDARVVGEALRRADRPQNINDLKWLSSLSDASVMQLAADVNEVARESNIASSSLVAVLRASAMAQGPGIPWGKVWPGVLEAIMQKPVARSSMLIRFVLASRLGGYLTAATDGNERVFRPVHERLTETLRDRPYRLISNESQNSPVLDSPAEVHARIARILARQVVPSLEPDPYIARYLVRHAALGRVLNDEVVPKALLPWETSGEVRGGLGLPLTSDPAKRILAAWAVSEPYAGLLTPADRAATIEFHESNNPTSRNASWTVARNVLTALESGIESIAFGRVEGAAVLATGDRDGSARLWDPNTGAPVGGSLLGHRDWVNGVAFGAIGQITLLATGSGDRTVRLWDPATGLPTREPLVGHTGRVSAVTFGQVGRRTILATASNDRTVRLWNPATGDGFGDPLVHADSVNDVAFGQVGDKVVLATACNDRAVRLWNPLTFQPIRDPLVGHDGRVTSVAFGRIGKTTVLASGSSDGTVRLWDPATGEPLCAPFGHSGGVKAVSLGRVEGQSILASGGADRTVRLWDPVRGTSLGDQLTGHADWVNAVAFAERSEGSALISGSSDQTVRVWDLPRTPSPEKRAPSSEQLRRAQPGAVLSVAYGQVGSKTTLATGGADRKVRLWDSVNHEAVGDPLSGHEGTVRSVAFGQLAEKSVLASGSNDGTVRLWDPANSRPIGTPLRGHRGPVRAVAFGRVGEMTMLASGSQDRTLQLWDPETGSAIGEPLIGHEGWVRALAFGQVGDSAVIATGGSDHRICMWHPSSGTRIGEPLIGHTGWVNAVAFGEVNGAPVLASGSGDGTVRLWDAERGVPMADPLKGHAGWVRAVQFVQIAGRALVASSGNDATLRFWDPISGSLLRTIAVAATVTALAVEATGSNLAFGGRSGFAVIDLKKVAPNNG